MRETVLEPVTSPPAKDTIVEVATEGVTRSDRDDLSGAERRLRSHLGRDAVGLFDQSGDDVGLGHGLDDLALHEDLPLAVAGRDTEVRLTGLTRSVHDAAHDGHAQRH